MDDFIKRRTRLVFASKHSGKQAHRLIQYFGLKIICSINVEPDVKRIKWDTRCKKRTAETQVCIDELMERCNWHWREAWALESKRRYHLSLPRHVTKPPAPFSHFPQWGPEQDLRRVKVTSLAQKGAYTPTGTQHQSPLRHPQCPSQFHLISSQACGLRWPLFSVLSRATLFH